MSSHHDAALDYGGSPAPGDHGGSPVPGDHESWSHDDVHGWGNKIFLDSI